MINKITIQNFKSIKGKIEIDLKPITLLFGPNSAGKSTVVQALHYMKEILEKNNTDPGSTDLGGEVIDLGGFANLVHRKEGDPEELFKNNPIIIGFEIEENDLLEPEYLKNDLLQNSGYDPYYIEFTIEWDDKLPGPIVKKYDVHINGEFIGEIEMAGWNADDYDEDSVTSFRKKKQIMYGKGIDFDDSMKIPKFNITKLNLEHPNLIWSADYETSDENDEPELKLKDIIEELPTSKSKIEKSDILRSKIEKIDNKIEENGDDVENIDELKDERDRLVADLEYLRDIFVYYDDTAFPSDSAIRIKKPALENQFNTGKETKEDPYDYIEHIDFINDTLTQIFCTPIKFLKSVLGDFCYIGPLRTIPERLFNLERTPIGSRWSDGLGAWDMVYRTYKSDNKDEKELIINVNKWLSTLGTGYSILVKEYKEIDTNNPLAMGIDENGRMFEDGEDVRRSFESLPTQSRLQLIEGKNQIEVTAKDIGSGIAQVFPLIVATVSWKSMLVAVEQPELHIHPAIQLGLADMLIPYTHHNRFIILETHSEHIMLRLLRRIEETNNNELPSPDHALKHDEISVVYVEPTDDGVKMTKLPIDETGEFVGSWPKGFFEEREQELFKK